MYQVDIDEEVNRLFNDLSIAESGDPKAVILMGGVATGKTTLRMRDYSQGYVVIDAAEIFHHMSRGDATLNFPDALRESLELIGTQIARRALEERRNIVTEIIGAKPEPTKDLISWLRALGYKAEMVGVTCDVEEAMRRNEARGDNISAYYAERFQRKWIIEACRELIKERDQLGMQAAYDALNFFKSKKSCNTDHDFMPLHFKDGSAALEYACKFLQADVIEEGTRLPALILDARSTFDAEDPVKVQEDGTQLVVLRVASSDGGFVVMATTTGPKGPKLHPGQLVVWQAMKHLPEIASRTDDKRSGWVGLVIGTLKLEYRNNEWVGDEEFGH
jgi:dephospho-CoA kinase